MEISSGGGGSEPGDHPPQFKQHHPAPPHHPEMGFRTGAFRPGFPGPHPQPWRVNGPGPNPHMIWNEFNNPRYNIVETEKAGSYCLWSCNL